MPSFVVTGAANGESPGKPSSESIGSSGGESSDGSAPPLDPGPDEVAELLPDLVCFFAAPSPDPVKARILYLNPAGRELCGLSGDLRDRPLCDLFPSGEIERVLSPALAGDGDGRFDGEATLRVGDQGRVPVQLTLVPRRDGTYFLLGRDLTEQKQAEEMLMENASILMSIYAVDSILMGTAEVVGEDIVLHSGSPAASDFAGLDVEALCHGSSLPEPPPGAVRLRPYTPLWLHHYRESLRTGHPERFEIHCESERGRRWLRATISPIHSLFGSQFGSQLGPQSEAPPGPGPATGARRLFTYVLDNITELKETQLALIKARDEAVLASLHKSQFLASMSHEIRTPMNGVIGMIGLLLDGEISGEEREFAETARSSAEILLSLLNDILDLSKIEAGKMTLEHVEFDLHKVLLTTIQLRREAAHSKSTVLTCDINPAVPRVVMGDPVRVQQVLGNLLSNALKFTVGGKVHLSARPDGDSLRFEVRDSGIGISEEGQKRLFQPFSQADSSTTRHYGGTGLGLCICKQIVELMGGQIGVRSVPGQGSTFHFNARLPAAPSLTPDKQLAPPPRSGSPLVELPPAPPHPRERPSPVLPLSAQAESPLGRFLLVEDNAVNQGVAVRLLQRLGYQVDVAQNGREAVAAVQTVPYDAVFMDCRMPVLDGYEATAEIRQAEPPDRHVPIIALTANVMQGDREKCLEVGMDEYLPKPVKLDQLRAVLDKMLPGRHTG